MLRGWSSCDKEKLYRLFQTRCSLAEMAQKMGKSKTAVNKFLTRSKIRPLRCENFSRPLLEKPIWVTLDAVTEYLRRQGHEVVLQNEDHRWWEKAFMVDSKPASPTKLLIVANRKRMETHQRTFCIRGVTWQE